MFSSNQRFEVSGDSKEQLRDCLEFAIKMADLGERFNPEYNDVVFQKIGDIFCLGTASKKNSDELIGKWQRFPFDFDVNIVSEIIWQFIQKQDFRNAEDYFYNSYDGAVYKGFVMRALDTEDAYDRDLDEKIDKMYFGFVYFKPFNTFYSK